MKITPTSDIQIPLFQPMLITPATTSKIIFKWNTIDISTLCFMSNFALSATPTAANSRQARIIGELAIAKITKDATFTAIIAFNIVL